jgi:transglutaminase-like putative cysteine protease
VRFPEAGATGALGADVAIPEGPGQTVRRGDGPGWLLVRIDPPRAPSTSEDSRAAWRSDEALAGSLRPGVTVDADHAAVRAFAAAVCEGAGSPTEEALRLEKAVRDRIEEDDLKTVFATASQTLASRSGDCTEHAVLLTACLRARGIPARFVAGLVPIGSTMLYHLWSEAYLGTWVALDATIGSSRSHPCALALARWDQPEEGLAEFQIAMTRLGGIVRIEVASPR